MQRLIEYFRPSSKMYGDVELRPEVLPLNLFTLALFDLVDDLMDAPNVRPLISRFYTFFIYLICNSFDYYYFYCCRKVENLF